MSNFDFEIISNILNQKNGNENKRRMDDVNESNKKVCLAEIDINTLGKIEKRNARERNRVKLVNSEFENLRNLLLNSEICNNLINNGHYSNGNDESNGSIASLSSKRISKLKILRIAIEYISYLSNLLENAENSNLDLDFFNFDTDLADIDLSFLQASSPLVDNFFM